jgi:hypothetical protein
VAIAAIIDWAAPGYSRTGAISATAQGRERAAELADLRRLLQIASLHGAQPDQPQNVSQLKIAWAYQMQRAGVVETSPIVVDGIMYLTEPPSTVTALDVRSGRPIWSTHRSFRRTSS